MYGALASIIALSISIAQAAPTATGFSSTCTDLSYNEGWITGNCLTGADSTTRISSSAFLPNKLENSQGQLAWQADGEFWESCETCFLVNAGPEFQCYCYGTFNNQSGNTTINLEEHIANYNGHLLSDLTGTPTVPKDSSVAVPSDFGVTIEASTSIQTACSGGGSIVLNWPLQCWFLNITGTPTQWSGGYLTDNQAWQIGVYSNPSCTGTPLTTFVPSDGQTCKQFPSDAIAFLSTPLWNWG